MSIDMTRDTMLGLLMADASLEMTGKDVAQLLEAKDAIPVGSRVNVTFLENEDLAMRLEAARTVKALDLVPVPHLSARRLRSADMLQESLTALQREGATESVFVIGGDPSTPHGPYEDALSVIRSGLLEAHGVRRVSIAGYPEGHPDISGGDLWAALQDKAGELVQRDLAGDIITQFGFDVDPVIAWIEQVRGRGITMPVRVGVPGPAGIRRLVRYAARFGVGASSGIAKKYGFSITNLMGTAGPDRFIRELADRYDPAAHGEVKLHFYTFGGVRTTSEWIAGFRAAQLTAEPRAGQLEEESR